MGGVDGEGRQVRAPVVFGFPRVGGTKACCGGSLGVCSCCLSNALLPPTPRFPLSHTTHHATPPTPPRPRRPDVLPPPVLAELSKLQDRIEPFSTPQARAVVEAELGRPIDEVFSEFSEKPVAAASLAQVRVRAGRRAGGRAEGGWEGCRWHSAQAQRTACLLEGVGERLGWAT